MQIFRNETGAVVRQPSEVLLVQQFRLVRGGLTRGDVASAGFDVISVKQCLAEEPVDVLVGCRVEHEGSFAAAFDQAR